ncbi:hypothetical protein BC826DRAFT_556001 [Russula brevipes]|nr:hypothetical protein BC826DRAFT_556001 [Russula brevipes]
MPSTPLLSPWLLIRSLYVCGMPWHPRLWPTHLISGLGVKRHLHGSRVLTVLRRNIGHSPNYIIYPNVTLHHEVNERLFPAGAHWARSVIDACSHRPYTPQTDRQT